MSDHISKQEFLDEFVPYLKSWLGDTPHSRGYWFMLTEEFVATRLAEHLRKEDAR